MQTPKLTPFTVMDASAGSGKTRNLVKAVLVQALGQADVRLGVKPVLALTFTNKAAAEMKHRLLEYLIDFAQKIPREQKLLDEISAELRLAPGIVQNRAALTLKHILHRYNDLSFGTLDSFTSRLVRTFAKDMSLSENFEITLDLETLLYEATDAVMSMAGRDEELTGILVNFMEQKLADEKSHNLEGAIYTTAKKLMEERHREPLDRLRAYTPEQLLDIRKRLIAKSEKRKGKLREIGQRAIDLMESNGLMDRHFYYGGTGIFKYFHYVAEANLIKSAAPNSYVVKTLEEGKWHGGKISPQEKNLVDMVQPELDAIANEGLIFAATHAPFILLAEKICQNMFALATLNALNQALANLTEARNTIPLAAFNHIVHEQLQNEPSNYIFERLGDRYNHFFLDEFQDTSLLQWGNLKPLISNSLAAGGTALVVGDAKQSIYRWRNGEAEQFISLSAAANAKTFQFAGDADLIRLAENWRSLENVVTFNNRLFTHAAALLADEGYRRLYESAGQFARKGAGGCVELRLFEKEGYEETAVAYTLSTIKNLREEGFAYRDIALLVRSKKHGVELVQVLTSAGIPVISADSLLLGSAHESRLLAGLTALRTMPDNKQMRWLMADSLVQSGLLSPPEGAFAFAQKLIQSTSGEAIDILESYFSGIKPIYAAATDLYTFTRQLVGKLGLAGKNNAFVETYVQAVYDFVETDLGTGFDFVTWWLEEGSSKAINAAENRNAVQVVTIHKSKGLQYPVVVLPFAIWKHSVGTREAWLQLDPETFEGLSEMIIPLNSEPAPIIGGEYEATYNQLVAQDVFDSLNMLYVACTRAIERLYIGTSDKAEKGSIGEVIHSFCAAEEGAKTDENVYRWGKPAAPIQQETQIENVPLQPLLAADWHGRLTLARTAPPAWETNQRDARQWGNRVHFVLSRVGSVHDVASVLSQLKNEGALHESEIQELDKIINAVLAHPDLTASFAPGNHVFNERDILLPDGERKRPDRIVQHLDGTLTLLDYKTGEPEAAHGKQILGYAALLAEAGFSVSACYLVYLETPTHVVKL
jgi:ATP-dependent exoDNAse (exonuclease V) beta subunit